MWDQIRSFLVFYLDKELPASFKTTSLIVGGPMFAYNVYWQFYAENDEDRKEQLKWTRPFCEIMVVAGLLMTTMQFVRKPAAVGNAEQWLSYPAHVLVGWSAVGAPVTAEGIWLCVGVLVVALLVYASLETCAVNAWPYPLAPLEVGTLCISFLVMRMV